VLFAHDTTAALLAAVELVNSAEEPDTMTEIAQLDAFFAKHRYTGVRAHAYGVVPQLVRHDGLDYHLHVADPQTPLPDRIAAETAMAMIDLIRSDELSRLSTCADENCDGIVLDLSRNRSRRYCSTTCGNRNAVAAYRARRR
jgi:hypothetical protein